MTIPDLRKGGLRGIAIRGLKGDFRFGHFRKCNCKTLPRAPETESETGASPAELEFVSRGSLCVCVLPGWAVVCDVWQERGGP